MGIFLGRDWRKVELLFSMSMERRSAKPRWGWLFSAILLFWGVLLLRASTEDVWARGLLLVWGLIIVALCFLKSNEPR